MNLERSINSLAKRLDRFDPVFPYGNKTGLSQWKGKPIIPLEEWFEIRDTPYRLGYFPDDFDQILTFILEDELEQELIQVGSLLNLHGKVRGLVSYD